MRNYLYALFAYIRFIFIHIFICKKFKFTKYNLIYPKCIFEFDKNAKVTIGKLFAMRYNSQLNVRGGTFFAGNDVFFNSNSIITCHGKITIGDNCKFGPNTMIYDHDHNMRTSIDSVKSRDFYIGEIEIGDGCWFGANCIILKGAKIGDHCVFGAGSIIRGTYDSNSIVIQKRQDTIRKWEN